LRKEKFMICRKLTVAAVASYLSILACTGCSNEKVDHEARDAAIRASEPQWALVGEYVRQSHVYVHDDHGGYWAPSEYWIATITVPDGAMTKLVRNPIKPPDGREADRPNVSYNASRKVLICEREESYDDGPHVDDVWRYDLATGQSRWIAKNRWDDVRGFAWSPDGSKVAFVASTRGAPAAVVMQYDLDTDKLEQLAAQALGPGEPPEHGDEYGCCAMRPRRPVYSEDGNWLYYISADQHVMRLDLRTKAKGSEQLPFANAFLLLTVRGEHIVYVRHAPKGGDKWRFEAVKAPLAAPDDSRAQQIYASSGVMWGTFVSPSRHFVILSSRYGYGGEYRLVDVDNGTASWAGGLCGGDGFEEEMGGTAFTEGPSQPASRAVEGSK
jgi:hypothetical protein